MLLIGLVETLSKVGQLNASALQVDHVEAGLSFFTSESRDCRHPLQGLNSLQQSSKKLGSWYLGSQTLFW